MKTQDNSKHTRPKLTHSGHKPLLAIYGGEMDEYCDNLEHQRDELLEALKYLYNNVSTKDLAGTGWNQKIDKLINQAEK